MKSTLLFHTLLSLLVTIIMCSFSQTCSKSNQTSGGFELRLHHIDSPSSPMYEPELTNFERTKRLIAISEARMRYLFKNTENDIHEISPLTIQSTGGPYYVQLGLGQFNYDHRFQTIFLIFDTASHLTWTQCEGCRVCFHHIHDDFQRRTSQTYASYGCNDCPGGHCVQDHCTAMANYSDGTEIRGFWASEKLTFVSSFYAPQPIYGFNFICAMETTKFEQGSRSDNVITGILGVGRGPYSLMSQLGSRGFGRNQFSYCLQDTNNLVDNFPMLLRFGDSIVREYNMYTIPLDVVADIPFYYVRLTGIRVNGELLPIPFEVFAIQADNSGGTIFDSGSMLTYLVPRAYNVLVTRIKSLMESYNPHLRWNEQAEQWGYACWEGDFDNPITRFPTLAFHFAVNVNLFVDTAQVMFDFEMPGHSGLKCLTVHKILQEGNPNIIGTYHQVNKLIIYDYGNSRLYFTPADCATRR